MDSKGSKRPGKGAVAAGVAEESKLLAQLVARPPVNGSWVSRLTPAQRAEAEAIREAIRDGRIKTSLTQCAKAMAAEFGVVINRCAFANWVKNGEAD